MDFLCFAAVAVQMLRDQWSFSSRRTKEIADEYITGNRPRNSHGKHFISSINYIMMPVRGPSPNLSCNHLVVALRKWFMRDCGLLLGLGI